MYYYIYIFRIGCPTICTLSNHHHRTFELSKSIIHTHVMIFSARTAHHVRIATHTDCIHFATSLPLAFLRYAIATRHSHSQNGEQRQIGFHSISIAASTRRVRQKSVDEKSCTTFGWVIWQRYRWPTANIPRIFLNE